MNINWVFAAQWVLPVETAFLGCLDCPYFSAERVPVNAIIESRIRNQGQCRSPVKITLTSLMCYVFCSFNRNLPESKNVHFVLRFRINRDPPARVCMLDGETSKYWGAGRPVTITVHGALHDWRLGCVELPHLEKEVSSQGAGIFSCTS